MASAITAFTVIMVFVYVIIFRRIRSSLIFSYANAMKELEKAFRCPKDLKLVWSITYHRGCHKTMPVNYVAAVAYIITDAVIYLLPLRSLLSLPLSTKDRCKPPSWGFAFGTAGFGGALTRS